MKVVATLWVVLLIALHQDFWLWNDRTLVLGFLPIGLAYHAAYTVLVALTMGALVKVAWPRDHAAEEPREGDRP